MEDRQQEAARAQKLRLEYARDVEAVQTWIQAAEVKVQNKNVEPTTLKEFLQEIQCEIGTVTDQLERIKRHGAVIVERTSSVEEKELVLSTVTALTEQLGQVTAWLEDKKTQVGDSLESWQSFIQMYNSLKSWIERQKSFLAEPLKFATLAESRAKLQEYTAAVKDGKWATKQVSDMAAELSKIGQVSNVSPLSDKQTEIEQEKSEVESKLKEVMALLQEMAEEWEQCERKSRDVATWIERTQQSLSNPQNKKRPLRDQLTAREKVLADITIQRTKLVMSMEKLQVHFRDRMCAEAKVAHENERLQNRLKELLVAVKEDCKTLEACVHQMDAYQQEIQQYRGSMVGIERQLRQVSSPTYSPRDRDKAAAEQSILESQCASAKNAIAQLCERIYAIDPYESVTTKGSKPHNTSDSNPLPPMDTTTICTQQIYTEANATATTTMPPATTMSVVSSSIDSGTEIPPFSMNSETAALSLSKMSDESMNDEVSSMLASGFSQDYRFSSPFPLTWADVAAGRRSPAVFTPRGSEGFGGHERTPPQSMMVESLPPSSTFATVCEERLNSCETRSEPDTSLAADGAGAAAEGGKGAASRQPPARGAAASARYKQAGVARGNVRARAQQYRQSWHYYGQHYQEPYQGHPSHYVYQQQSPYKYRHYPSYRTQYQFEKYQPYPMPHQNKAFRQNRKQFSEQQEKLPDQQGSPSAQQKQKKQFNGERLRTKSESSVPQLIIPRPPKIPQDSVVKVQESVSESHAVTKPKQTPTAQPKEQERKPRRYKPKRQANEQLQHDEINETSQKPQPQKPQSQQPQPQQQQHAQKPIEQPMQHSAPKPQLHQPATQQTPQHPQQPRRGPRPPQAQQETHSKQADPNRHRYYQGNKAYPKSQGFDSESKLPSRRSDTQEQIKRSAESSKHDVPTQRSGQRDSPRHQRLSASEQNSPSKNRPNAPKVIYSRKDTFTSSRNNTSRYTNSKPQMKSSTTAEGTTSTVTAPKPLSPDTKVESIGQIITDTESMEQGFIPLLYDGKTSYAEILKLTGDGHQSYGKEGQLDFLSLQMEQALLQQPQQHVTDALTQMRQTEAVMDTTVDTGPRQESVDPAMSGAAFVQPSCEYTQTSFIKYIPDMTCSCPPANIESFEVTDFVNIDNMTPESLQQLQSLPALSSYMEVTSYIPDEDILTTTTRELVYQAPNTAELPISTQSVIATQSSPIDSEFAVQRHSETNDIIDLNTKMYSEKTTTEARQEDFVMAESPSCEYYVENPDTSLSEVDKSFTIVDDSAVTAVVSSDSNSKLTTSDVVDVNSGTSFVNEDVECAYKPKYKPCANIKTREHVHVDHSVKVTDKMNGGSETEGDMKVKAKENLELLSDMSTVDISKYSYAQILAMNLQKRSSPVSNTSDPQFITIKTASKLDILESEPIAYPGNGNSEDRSRTRKRSLDETQITVTVTEVKEETESRSKKDKREDNVVTQGYTPPGVYIPGLIFKSRSEQQRSRSRSNRRKTALQREEQADVAKITESKDGVAPAGAVISEKNKDDVMNEKNRESSSNSKEWKVKKECRSSGTSQITKERTDETKQLYEYNKKDSVDNKENAQTSAEKTAVSKQVEEVATKKTEENVSAKVEVEEEKLKKKKKKTKSKTDEEDELEKALREIADMEKSGKIEKPKPVDLSSKEHTDKQSKKRDRKKISKDSQVKSKSDSVKSDVVSEQHLEEMLKTEHEKTDAKHKEKKHSAKACKVDNVLNLNESSDSKVSEKKKNVKKGSSEKLSTTKSKTIVQTTIDTEIVKTERTDIIKKKTFEAYESKTVALTNEGKILEKSTDVLPTGSISSIIPSTTGAEEEKDSATCKVTELPKPTKEESKERKQFNLPIPAHASDWMDVIEGGGFTLSSDDEEEVNMIEKEDSTALPIVEHPSQDGVDTMSGVSSLASSWIEVIEEVKPMDSCAARRCSDASLGLSDTSLGSEDESQRKPYSRGYLERQDSEISRKVLMKRIILKDGVPSETEEYITDTEDEMAADLHELASRKVSKRRTLEKMIFIDGRHVDEEALHENIEVRQRHRDQEEAAASSAHAGGVPGADASLRPSTDEESARIKGHVEYIEEVISDEEEVITVTKKLRKVIKKIVYVDGEPVETEEVMEDQGEEEKDFPRGFGKPGSEPMPKEPVLEVASAVCADSKTAKSDSEKPKKKLSFSLPEGRDKDIHVAAETSLPVGHGVVCVPQDTSSISEPNSVCRQQRSSDRETPKREISESKKKVSFKLEDALPVKGDIVSATGQDSSRSYKLVIPDHANDWMEIMESGGFTLDSDDDEELPSDVGVTEVKTGPVSTETVVEERTKETKSKQDIPKCPEVQEKAKTESLASSKVEPEKPAFNLKIPDHGNDWMDIINEGGFTMDSEDEDEQVPVDIIDKVDIASQKEEQIPLVVEVDIKNKVNVASQKEQIPLVAPADIKDKVEIVSQKEKQIPLVAQVDIKDKVEIVSQKEEERLVVAQVDIKDKVKIVSQKEEQIPLVGPADIKDKVDVVAQKEEQKPSVTATPDKAYNLPIPDHADDWMSLMTGESGFSLEDEDEPATDVVVSVAAAGKLPSVPDVGSNVPSVSVELKVPSVPDVGPKTAVAETTKEEAAKVQQPDEKQTTSVALIEKENIQKQSTFNLPIPEHASDWMSMMEEGSIPFDDDDDEDESPIASKPEEATLKQTYDIPATTLAETSFNVAICENKPEKEPLFADIKDIKEYKAVFAGESATVTIETESDSLEFQKNVSSEADVFNVTVNTKEVSVEVKSNSTETITEQNIIKLTSDTKKQAKESVTSISDTKPEGITLIPQWLRQKPAHSAHAAVETDPMAMEIISSFEERKKIFKKKTSDGATSHAHHVEFTGTDSAAAAAARSETVIEKPKEVKPEVQVDTAMPVGEMRSDTVVTHTVEPYPVSITASKITEVPGKVPKGTVTEIPEGTVTVPVTEIPEGTVTVPVTEVNVAIKKEPDHVEPEFSYANILMSGKAILKEIIEPEPQKHPKKKVVNVATAEHAEVPPVAGTGTDQAEVPSAAGTSTGQAEIPEAAGRAPVPSTDEEGFTAVVSKRGKRRKKTESTSKDDDVSAAVDASNDESCEAAKDVTTVLPDKTELSPGEELVRERLEGLNVAEEAPPEATEVALGITEQIKLDLDGQLEDSTHVEETPINDSEIIALDQTEPPPAEVVFSPEDFPAISKIDTFLSPELPDQVSYATMVLTGEAIDLVPEEEHEPVRKAPVYKKPRAVTSSQSDEEPATKEATKASPVDEDGFMEYRHRRSKQQRTSSTSQEGGGLDEGGADVRVRRGSGSNVFVNALPDISTFQHPNRFSLTKIGSDGDIPHFDDGIVLEDIYDEVETSEGGLGKKGDLYHKDLKVLELSNELPKVMDTTTLVDTRDNVLSTNVQVEVLTDEPVATRVSEEPSLSSPKSYACVLSTGTPVLECAEHVSEEISKPCKEKTPLIIVVKDDASVHRVVAEVDPEGFSEVLTKRERQRRRTCSSSEVTKEMEDEIMHASQPHHRTKPMPTAATKYPDISVYADDNKYDGLPATDVEVDRIAVTYEEIEETDGDIISSSILAAYFASEEVRFDMSAINKAEERYYTYLSAHCCAAETGEDTLGTVGLPIKNIENVKAVPEASISVDRDAQLAAHKLKDEICKKEKAREVIARAIYKDEIKQSKDSSKKITEPKAADFSSVINDLRALEIPTPQYDLNAINVAETLYYEYLSSLEHVDKPEVIEKLATSAPRVEELATSASTIDKLATSTPTIDKLATSTPTIEKLAKISPRVEELATSSPRVENLAISAPTVDIAATAGKTAKTLPPVAGADSACIVLLGSADENKNRMLLDSCSSYCHYDINAILKAETKYQEYLATAEYPASWADVVSRPRPESPAEEEPDNSMAFVLVQKKTFQIVVREEDKPKRPSLNLVDEEGFTECITRRERRRRILSSCSTDSGDFYSESEDYVKDVVPYVPRPDLPNLDHLPDVVKEEKVKNVVTGAVPERAFEIQLEDEYEESQEVPQKRTKRTSHKRSHKSSKLSDVEQEVDEIIKQIYKEDQRHKKEIKREQFWQDKWHYEDAETKYYEMLAKEKRNREVDNRINVHDPKDDGDCDGRDNCNQPPIPKPFPFSHSNGDGREAAASHTLLGGIPPGNWSDESTYLSPLASTITPLVSVATCTPTSCIVHPCDASPATVSVINNCDSLYKACTSRGSDNTSSFSSSSAPIVYSSHTNASSVIHVNNHHHDAVLDRLTGDALTGKQSDKNYLKEDFNDGRTAQADSKLTVGDVKPSSGGLVEDKAAMKESGDAVKLSESSLKESAAKRDSLSVHQASAEHETDQVRCCAPEITFGFQ